MWGAECGMRNALRSLRQQSGFRNPASAIRLPQYLFRIPRSSELGQVELEDCDETVRPRHYVFRLDVAVHDPRRVRRRERFRDLPRHVERRGQAQWPASHLIAQCLAFDKLADDVMRAFGFADLVNGQDVWMVESGGRLRLPLKPEQAIRILFDGGGQYFERDLAFESGVLGQEDFSHAASAEQADDLVWPDAPPDRRLIEIIRGRPRGFRKDW